MLVNGENVAERKDMNAAKYLASASSEGFSVGKDLNSPVTRNYPGTFAFTGAVKQLVIEQREQDQEKVGLLKK